MNRVEAGIYTICKGIERNPIIEIIVGNNSTIINMTLTDETISKLDYLAEVFKNLAISCKKIDETNKVEK